MSIVLSNFIQVTQGPRNKPIRLWSPRSMICSDLVSLKQIIIVVITAILLSVFWYIVNPNPARPAERATSRTEDGLRCSVSMSTARLVTSSWAPHLALSRDMYLMYYGVVVFTDGFAPGVKAFTAAVSRWDRVAAGAVLGGLLIGLIESLWSAYFTIDYKDVATSRFSRSSDLQAVRVFSDDRKSRRYSFPWQMSHPQPQAPAAS